MLLKNLLITFIILISLNSCSKKEPEYVPTEKIDPYSVYKLAYEGFEKRDFFYASKKFFEAELNFTVLELAAKSAIMGSYCLYGINFYDEALQNLNRYLKKYPDNEYSIDLKFKKDLILNQMAAKELYIAKYYISVQKWIPAIKRLKNIVESYDQTIFIEEALHRLVEIYFLIGMENKAKKYAKILGYNYNSSKWFENSYKILNKDYKIIKNKKPKVKKDSIIKKIINKIK